MKIFISGSMSIKKLDQVIILKIDEIIAKHNTILVGDAGGVDWEIQKYLAGKNHQNVLVYYSSEKCERNAGKWPEIYVENPENIQGQEKYFLKDIKMTKDADYGLMIWDGHSQGTKNNILNMKKINKKFEVYCNNTFYSQDDINQILE